MNLNASHSNKSDTEVSMSNTTKQHGESDSKTNATNLIVNYLPDTMSQEDVKSLFGSVGELESCKLIRDKNTGQSLGYAFVNYKNPLSAQRAIDRLNGLGLQNKIIKVSYARPSCETIKGANLYVSGLPQSITVQELNSIFSPNGTIIASRILMDSSTGLSKGVGFVRFDLRSQAEQAIKQLHGTIPKGCSEPIKVKFAGHPIARPPIPFVPPFFAAKSSFFQNPIRALAPRFFGLVQPPHRSLNCFRGCSLFVNNLTPDTDDQFLWQLFGPFGAVQNVRVVRDSKTQKCQGFGFVTMTHYEDALLAVSHLNGLYIGNRDKPLHVSF